MLLDLRNYYHVNKIEVFNRIHRESLTGELL